MMNQHHTCQRAPRLLRSLTWLIMLLVPAVSAYGQEHRALIDSDDLAGAPIRDIVLIGLERVSEQYVRNNLRAVEGAPYDPRLVRRDVQSLTRLGQFAYISAEIVLYGDGSVQIAYTFREQPMIADIQVVGNTVLSDPHVIAKTRLRPGDPADEDAIGRGLRTIEEAYREEGYYLVRADYDKAELADSGILYIRIREGTRVKLTSIRFEGNEHFADKILNGEIESETAMLFFEKGEIDTDRISRDVISLMDYYLSRGYLQARVGSDLRLSSNGREAIITFLIDEGPQFTLRSVRFEGNTRIDAAQLKAHMLIQLGDALMDRRLRRSVEAIRRAYNDLGYTNCRVRHDVLLDPHEPVADVVVTISHVEGGRLIPSEGNRYRTGLVVVKGNSLTRQSVILREVSLRPGRPLSRVELDRSVRRLERLNIFDRGSVKGTILDPDPLDPLYRDVLIEVEETNTASFNFGVAVSTDSGLFGQVGVTQRNFDLFDFPDSFEELLAGRAFRGGGQTFAISLAPGQETQNYSISLTDPRLFDSEYLLRTELFLRSRYYSSYDERRLGGAITFGRSIGDRWNASVTARVQTVNISDIDSSAPVDLFDVEGTNDISSIGMRLIRSSYDVPTFPSKGMRIKLAADRFGVLGGDYDFTRLEAEHWIFLPVLEDILGRRTVLSFETRIGLIVEEDEAPLFERFYLGGRSLRGFDYHGAAPIGVRPNGKLSSDTVGGRFLFKFSPELRYPLISDIFYGVVFLDTGTVSNEIGFDAYRVAAGFGFRVKVAALSPVPLAFDFAFPVMAEEGDDTRLFSFDIDIPF